MTRKGFHEGVPGHGQQESTVTPEESELKREVVFKPTPIDQLIPGIDMDKLNSALNKQVILNERYRQRKELSHDFVGLRRESFGNDVMQNFAGMSEALALGSTEGMESFREVSWEGKVVVDLGAGNDISGYTLAAIAGAAGYIGVEPFYTQELEEEIGNLDAAIETEQKELSGELDEERKMSLQRRIDVLSQKIPYTVVGTDMASMLETLPNQSVCIMANGIDSAVLAGSNYEHIKGIAKEIERVLHPEGSVFLNASTPLLRPGNLEMTELDVMGKMYKKIA